MRDTDQPALEQLLLEAKTMLRTAELTIHLENGDDEATWTFQGQNVAWAWGTPSNCQNKLRNLRSRRCVHLGLYWEKFVSPDMQKFIKGKLVRDFEFGGAIFALVKPDLYPLEQKLGEWINQEKIFAHKAELQGGGYIIRAFWHTHKSRWMFGPKEPRRGC